MNETQPNVLDHSPKQNITANKKNITALLFIQSINLACLFTELSYWMLAIIVLSILWRALCLYQRKYKLSRALLVFIALSGCVLLATSSLQLGLLLTMVHLLCFAYALKSFELKNRKDFYQIMLLGLFVLASSLIFQQSLYFSLLLVVIFVLNLSLLAWGFVNTLSFGQVFINNGKLLLQSLPLAIILFLFFPKLSPLWQVPVSGNAKTGLSDTVSVGDVANLALSNELAFRVSFEEAAPPYQQLYWRTLVMENFDGKNWRSKPISYKLITPSQPREFYSLNNTPLIKHVIKYQVIAPASYQHWLFALDVAVTNNSRILQLADYSLYSRKKVNKDISYQVNSYVGAGMDKSLSKAVEQENLAILTHVNPKLIAEAKTLRAKYPDDEKLIAAVLQKFNIESYRYTLRPPRLTENALDEFYFETKAGFCEHYATTFIYLMRSAGIPARLITGYLGGEYNPQGNYYSIYQRDAHAWTEVWLKGKGWQRVDPTAAVNPERVEKGFSELLQQEQSMLSDQLFDFSAFKKVAWLTALKYQFDALDYQWTRLVVGYSMQKQFNLLNNLSSFWYEYKTALLITLLIINFLIIAFFLWFKKSKPKMKNAWLNIYYKTLTLLENNGFEKSISTTPTAFCQQVSEKLLATYKNSAEAKLIVQLLHKLTTVFNRLQYTHVTGEEKNKLINQMVGDYKQLFNAFKILKISSKINENNFAK